MARESKIKNSKALIAPKDEWSRADFIKRAAAALDVNESAVMDEAVSFYYKQLVRQANYAPSAEVLARRAAASLAKLKVKEAELQKKIAAASKAA